MRMNPVLRLIKWGLSFFPSRLPTGKTEFEFWVGDVAHLSGLPYNDRLRAVTAQFIFSLPPTMDRFKKRTIAKQLRKAASNQVASEVLKLLDEEHKEKTKEESNKSLDQPVGSPTTKIRLQGHRRPTHRAS